MCVTATAKRRRKQNRRTPASRRAFGKRFRKPVMNYAMRSKR